MATKGIAALAATILLSSPTIAQEELTVAQASAEMPLNIKVQKSWYTDDNHSGANADGHRGYCLEFENVGPLFEHAKDVNYLDLEDMEIPVTGPSLLSGHFLFCKSREWSCEEEVRLVLSRKDGRIKVKFDPAWLTRIILGKAMSDKNKNTIRLWAKERNPELAVATTYYDATQRAIRLRND
jgi:hypothetical protein